MFFPVYIENKKKLKKRDKISLSKFFKYICLICTGATAIIRGLTCRYVYIYIYTNISERINNVM